MPDRSPSESFEPVCVELASPGMLADSRRFYTVDFVEADGGRACMWAGTDRDAAAEAAMVCAEGRLFAVDLTGPAPRPLPTGTLH